MAFMDRLKKGTVPPQIKDLWDNLKTREQKTKLINNVMTKSRRGYVFNEESEVVEALRRLSAGRREEPSVTEVATKEL